MRPSEVGPGDENQVTTPAASTAPTLITLSASAGAIR